MLPTCCTPVAPQYPVPHSTPSGGEADAKSPRIPFQAELCRRARSQFSNTSRARRMSKYGSTRVFYCSCDENQKPCCTVASNSPAEQFTATSLCCLRRHIQGLLHGTIARVTSADKSPDNLERATQEQEKKTRRRNASTDTRNPPPKKKCATHPEHTKHQSNATPQHTTLRPLRKPSMCIQIPKETQRFSSRCWGGSTPESLQRRLAQN